MLTAMSCRTQVVSIFVCIQLVSMLIGMSRCTQLVSVPVRMQ